MLKSDKSNAQKFNLSHLLARFCGDKCIHSYYSINHNLLFKECFKMLAI